MSKKLLLTTTAALAALPIALILHGQSPQLPHMQRTKFPKDDAAEAMFLVLFGEKTGHPDAWSGEIAVTSGQLENLRGYKLEPDDQVELPNRWRIAKRGIVERGGRGEDNLYFPGGYRGENGAGFVMTMI